MSLLHLSVVGHTNTGKTSLLRTLLRDETFGEVADESATTRHVEEAVIVDENGAPLLAIDDTPGLEDALGVLQWLEEHTDRRADGVERIRQFLDSQAAAEAYAQEAKVLRQMLVCDCALYVIDLREPVLDKYRDELTILSWCARPVMPVLNFVHQGDTAAWQTMLSRRNLHVISSFDTVAFDFDSEITLWQNLATMLPQRADLDTLITLRQNRWQAMERNARFAIADFLLNIAAFRREIDEDTHPEPILDEMKQAVEAAEGELHRNLLHEYRFYRNQVSATPLNLRIFHQSIFDPEVWKAYGIKSSSGAAAGVLFGLGIDAAVGGATLGAGALIGGAIGGLMPHLRQIRNAITGMETLYIDPAALTLLAARALALLDLLRQRGHASLDELSPESQRLPWQLPRLPSELRQARSHADWSALNGENPADAAEQRRAAAYRLAEDLKKNS
ncbi:MAG: GTPase/DUF3482 domain-containing protein [Neisseria sp.]|nr:GTPase/DUF3482 domain-containing protein [Neisseria sp.]